MRLYVCHHYDDSRVFEDTLFYDDFSIKNFQHYYINIHGVEDSWDITYIDNEGRHNRHSEIKNSDDLEFFFTYCVCIPEKLIMLFYLKYGKPP